MLYVSWCRTRVVIVLLAIAIHRTGKSNKLLHEKNKRERIREQAND